MGNGVLRSGFVYVIFDDQVRPPKPKWHICICPVQRWFLRINSRGLWTPSLQILAVENHFLDHDSYIELRALIRLRFAEVQQALSRMDNPKGEISRIVARQIVVAADRAPTLSDEHRDLVREALLGREEIPQQQSA